MSGRGRSRKKSHASPPARDGQRRVRAESPGGRLIFDERRAWEAIGRGVADMDNLAVEVRSQILSITVAGSLVRGDFVQNRSDVDVYTVVRGSMSRPSESEAHRSVRPCFDRHFAPYRGRSLNPFVWDDVCLAEGLLPHEPDQSGRHRLKALGIYYFDFLRHHNTVWGEDFTRRLPGPADPKPLVAERLSWLMSQAERIAEGEFEDRGRLPLLVGEAVKALQIYFGPEPSLDKSRTTRRYVGAVPHFPEKPFGLAVWKDYLNAEAAKLAQPPRPLEEHVAFLQAARQVVEQNTVRALQ